CLMLLISHQTRSVVIPYNPQLATLFPHSKRFDYEGSAMLALPHGIDETRLLRNLGWPELPSPIEEHYDFPSVDGCRPFGKQVLTSAAMTMNDRFHNLNAMGTGKTKSAIWAYHFLKTDGLADKMLVAAPLSTLNFTWAREIMNTIPSLRVRVLIGDAEKRRKLLAEDADIYIINHAGLRIISNELRLRPDINVYCFDEAAAYRNAQTE